MKIVNEWGNSASSFGNCDILAETIVTMVIPIRVPSKNYWVGLQIRNSDQPVSDCWFSGDSQRKLSSDQHIGSNILVKYELSRSQSKALIKSASAERLRFHTNLISSLQLAFLRIAGARKTTKIVRRLSQTSFLNKTPLEKFNSQDESRERKPSKTYEKNDGRGSNFV